MTLNTLEGLCIYIPCAVRGRMLTVTETSLAVVPSRKISSSRLSPSDATVVVLPAMETFTSTTVGEEKRHRGTEIHMHPSESNANNIIQKPISRE